MEEVKTSFDLKELRLAADKATDAAFHHKWEQICVNWGDLSAVSAEHYVTEEGEEGYRVYIEEADPSNHEFRTFVAKQLAEAGFPGVEVVTEW